MPTPSPDTDKSAGLPVKRRPYTGSDADFEATLRDIATKIREGGRTPSIRSMAGLMLKESGFPQGIAAQAEALRAAMRAKVGYQPDPPMVEMVVSAPITLCAEGAAVCISIGDCDDLCVALGSLLLASGIDTQCLVQDYGRAGDQQHILLALKDESGAWLTVDPSSLDKPVGHKDQAVSEIWMDPLNPQALKINAPEGEFVGVGKPKTLGKAPCCANCAEGKPCTGCGSKVHPCPCETDQVLSSRPMFGAFGPALIVPKPPSPLDTGLPNLVNRRRISPRVRKPLLGQASSLDPSGKYTMALVDISAMATKIQEGDGYAKGPTPSYPSAITSYQAAGQLGAQTVGPEIDDAGAPEATKPFTQPAWNLNVALAQVRNEAVPGVPGTDPTQSDASSARALANTMLDYYQQAVRVGSAKQTPGTPESQQGNRSAVGTIITLSVVGGLLYAGYKMASRPRRRRAYG